METYRQTICLYQLVDAHMPRTPELPKWPRSQSSVPAVRRFITARNGAERVIDSRRRSDSGGGVPERVLAGNRPRILIVENPLNISAAIVDKALDGDDSSTTGDDDADEHDDQEYAFLLRSTLYGGHPSTLRSPANPLRCFRRTYILQQALRFFGSIFLRSFCSAYDGLTFLSHPAFSLSISSCPCGILFLTAGNPRRFFFARFLANDIVQVLLKTPRDQKPWTMDDVPCDS